MLEVCNTSQEDTNSEVASTEYSLHSVTLNFIVPPLNGSKIWRGGGVELSHTASSFKITMPPQLLGKLYSVMLALLFNPILLDEFTKAKLLLICMSFEKFLPE